MGNHVRFTQDKPPKTAGPGLFATMVVCMVLSGLPGIGIVFGVVVLVYLIMLYLKMKDAWVSGRSIHTRFEEQRAKLAHVRSELKRLGGMTSEARQDEARRIEQLIEADREALRQGRLEADHLASEVVDLRDMAVLNDYGIYNFENPAEDALWVGDALKKTQTEYKAMVKNKEAATGAVGWTVNNSKAEGKKMVNEMTTLLLRAFNNEVENSVKSVKAGYLTRSKERVLKAAEQIERNGKQLSIQISGRYVQLRLKELELTHEYEEAKKAEREAEKEHNAQLREEARARKELEAAKAKQIKERAHRISVLAQVREQGDPEEIVRAEQELAHVEAEYAKAESTLANTRAGYVYIASNRGAFGEGVVKIGMTRRVNPDDRLKELSDASVPFNFDKHAMIWSDDAVGLENALHKHFSDVRVNLINMRREYFYATPAEVKRALLSHDTRVLEYHEKADAAEFSASEEMRRQKNSRARVSAMALAS